MTRWELRRRNLFGGVDVISTPYRWRWTARLACWVIDDHRVFVAESKIEERP